MVKLPSVFVAVALAVSGCSKSGHSLSGDWTVHRQRAVDTLTLHEKGGVLSGEIKLDPDFSTGTSDIHGIRDGTNVEWSFDTYFASTTPGDSGTVHYTMKGSVNGDTMSGQFSVLGPFNSRVENPHETDLWTAKKN